MSPPKKTILQGSHRRLTTRDDKINTLSSWNPTGYLIERIATPTPWSLSTMDRIRQLLMKDSQPGSDVLHERKLGDGLHLAWLKEGVASEI